MMDSVSSGDPLIPVIKIGISRHLSRTVLACILPARGKFLGRILLPLQPVAVVLIRQGPRAFRPSIRLIRWLLEKTGIGGVARGRRSDLGLDQERVLVFITRSTATEERQHFSSRVGDGMDLSGRNCDGVTTTNWTCLFPEGHVRGASKDVIDLFCFGVVV